MVRPTGQLARVTALLSGLLVLFLCATAEAQPPPPQRSMQSAIGFQGGASIDPEQVFAGVFWQSPSIGGRFHLRPGIDGGFGNDLRVATINIDFLVRFPIGNSGWNFVQGGGPTIVITKIPALELSDVGAGGSYIFGFARDNGFFAEFRIGGGSVPSLKMGVGYQLRF